MSSIVSDVEQQVRARVEELRPLVEEYEQLCEVLATFERAKTSRAAAAPPRRRRTKPSGSSARSSSAGARAQEALDLVTARPGITVAELAEELGIGPTYLYRVMPALEREAKVRKEGRGYVPAG